MTIAALAPVLFAALTSATHDLEFHSTERHLTARFDAMGRMNGEALGLRVRPGALNGIVGPRVVALRWDDSTLRGHIGGYRAALSFVREGEGLKAEGTIGDQPAHVFLTPGTLDVRTRGCTYEMDADGASYSGVERCGPGSPRPEAIPSPTMLMLPRDYERAPDGALVALLVALMTP